MSEGIVKRQPVPMRWLAKTRLVSNLRSRLVEVDIIRPIAILLVVFVHSTAVFTNTWVVPGLQHLEPVAAYVYLNDFLSSFRMPTIILIAGYVFAFLAATRATSFWQVLSSKFKRLMIPAWLFGTLYFLMFYEPNLDQFLRLVSRGIGHLWFLPMLFWNMVFGHFLNKINGKVAMFCVLTGLVVVSYFSMDVLNLLGIGRALYFAPVFYLGQVLYKIRPVVLQLACRSTFLAALGVAYFVCFALWLFLDHRLPTGSESTVLILRAANYLPQALGAVLFLCLALRFVSVRGITGVNLKPVLWCYGVYVWHEFVLQWTLRETDIGLVLGPATLPIALFVIATGVSLALTVLMLRTRVGRYLIG